jgi:hypothetical protein
MAACFEEDSILRRFMPYRRGDIRGLSSAAAGVDMISASAPCNYDFRFLGRPRRLGGAGIVYYCSMIGYFLGLPLFIAGAPFFLITVPEEAAALLSIEDCCFLRRALFFKFRVLLWC